MKPSGLKRYKQRQLTEIFCTQANIPIGMITEMQKLWWQNPLDAESLRLSIAGLSFVRNQLKLEIYSFVLPDEITNRNLLQLERYFPGMYYLVKRQKLFVFDEQDAIMLQLHGSDLKSYLENLETTNQ